MWSGLVNTGLCPGSPPNHCCSCDLAGMGWHSMQHVWSTWPDDHHLGCNNNNNTWSKVGQDTIRRLLKALVGHVGMQEHAVSTALTQHPSWCPRHSSCATRKRCVCTCLLHMVHHACTVVMHVNSRDACDKLRCVVTSGKAPFAPGNSYTIN